MNISTNAEANMEVPSVNKASVVEKPATLKRQEISRLDLSEELPPSKISKTDVEEMVEGLKNLTETLQTKLNFSVDKGTQSIVVKVIDTDTDQVIRQIPPEELLELQEKMQDLTGFLLDKIG